MMKYIPEHIVMAFLTSKTNAEISERTGLSPRTVSRYKTQPEFQHILQERRTAIVKETVDRMSAELAGCSEELLAIIHDSSVAPQTKIYGISVFASLWKDWTTTSDILARLDALETASNGSE